MESRAAFLAALPELGRLPESAVRRLDRAERLRVPEGAVLFRSGGPCPGFVTVLVGRVRVSGLDRHGRPVVLYRLERGESCLMSTASLLAGQESLAEAVAETPAELLLLPREELLALIGEAPAFRDFVFRDFGERLAALARVAGDLAYGGVDERLARKMIELADEGILHATHAELAREIGTAREVVTRWLGRFRKRGWVVLERGRIRIVDLPALRRAAESD